MHQSLEQCCWQQITLSFRQTQRDRPALYPGSRETTCIALPQDYLQSTLSKKRGITLNKSIPICCLAHQYLEYVWDNANIHEHVLLKFIQIEQLLMGDLAMAKRGKGFFLNTN